MSHPIIGSGRHYPIQSVAQPGRPDSITVVTTATTVTVVVERILPPAAGSGRGRPPLAPIRHHVGK